MDDWSRYREAPHDQVNWGELAARWIENKTYDDIPQPMFQSGHLPAPPPSQRSMFPSVSVEPLPQNNFHHHPNQDAFKPPWPGRGQLLQNVHSFDNQFNRPPPFSQGYRGPPPPPMNAHPHMPNNNGSWMMPPSRMFNAPNNGYGRGMPPLPSRPPYPPPPGMLPPPQHLAPPPPSALYPPPPPFDTPRESDCWRDPNPPPWHSQRPRSPNGPIGPMGLIPKWPASDENWESDHFISSGATPGSMAQERPVPLMSREVAPPPPPMSHQQSTPGIPPTPNSNGVSSPVGFGAPERKEGLEMPMFPHITMEQRKKLPAWILEGLEKAEREKARKAEKEEEIRRVEEARARRRALAGKGKFDSSSDEDDDNTSVDGHPVFLSKKNSGDSRKDNDDNYEEEQRKECFQAVRRFMTSLLLEATECAVRKVIDEAISEARRKAAPKLLVNSAALAAIASLGGDDSDDSDSEESEPARPVPSLDDSALFKAPLGFPARSLSKPSGDTPPSTDAANTAKTEVKDERSSSKVDKDSAKSSLFSNDLENKEDRVHRKQSRSRSRSPRRRRSRSRERKRSRSRSKERERRRSRSKDRDRKRRSRSRDKDRERDRRRSRSRSWERRDRRRSRSRSRDRKDRRRSRSRGR